MKKLLSILLIAGFVFGGLWYYDNYIAYGKKVTINDNLEVFMKGDNVTEDDAKKLGNYFAETWKENKNDKSFQLSKDASGYVVKMVVDEEKLKADSSLNVSFMAIQILLEAEVFKGSKVKLVLTNNKFKDIKSFDGNANLQNTSASTDSTSTSK